MTRSKDFEEETVEDAEPCRRWDLYIRAQSTMQKVRYAQKLLRNPEVESELQSHRMYDDLERHWNGCIAS